MSAATTAILTPIINLFVNPALYLLFALAVMYFLWGVFKFIQNSEESGGRAQGAKHIMYGIIGLVIMMSAFAIVRIIINTIGVPASEQPTSIPQLQS